MKPVEIIFRGGGEWMRENDWGSKSSMIYSLYKCKCHLVLTLYNYYHLVN
jgi:hypothetical protein